MDHALDGEKKRSGQLTNLWHKESVQVPGISVNLPGWFTHSLVSRFAVTLARG